MSYVEPQPSSPIPPQWRLRIQGLEEETRLSDPARRERARMRLRVYRYLRGRYRRSQAPVPATGTRRTESPSATRHPPVLPATWVHGTRSDRDTSGLRPREETRRLLRRICARPGPPPFDPESPPGEATVTPETAPDTWFGRSIARIVEESSWPFEGMGVWMAGVLLLGYTRIRRLCREGIRYVRKRRPHAEPAGEDANELAPTSP